MGQSFYDTIKSSSNDLIKHDITCKSQEERILAIFKESNYAMTPFEIEKLYSKLYNTVPITSIRRAMSNLTKDSKLVKTGCMKNETFGKPNFMWKYNDSLGR
jgi:hypothetical protein